MRCKPFFCTLISYVFISTACGDTLYRLPPRIDPELDLDSAAVAVFVKALDSALSPDFQIIAVENDSMYPPDSNVCSSFLSPAGGDSLLFEFDIYLAQNQGITSGEFTIALNEIDPSVVSLLIQQEFSGSSFGTMQLGRVRMVGCQGCRVFVNGELSGAMPFETFLPPGKYEFEAKGAKFLSDKHQLLLEPGDDTLLNSDLRALSAKIRNRLLVSGVFFGAAAAASHALQEWLYDRYTDPDKTRQDFDRRYRQYQLAVSFRNAFAFLSAGSLSAGLLIAVDIPRP